MRAKTVRESIGIPWSGKDPTKSPIIGKILTRRISIGDDLGKPEIMEVVEINGPYYIINKWYKSGTPQVVHEDQVSHFIPSDNYKDPEFENRTLEDES